MSFFFFFFETLLHFKLLLCCSGSFATLHTTFESENSWRFIFVRYTSYYLCLSTPPTPLAERIERTLRSFLRTFVPDLGACQSAVTSLRFHVSLHLLFSTEAFSRFPVG